METLLVAVAAITVGLGVGVLGTRFSNRLVPAWGLLTGLVLGADLVAAIAGDALFGTLVGWLAGAALGLLLAGIAALWFYGAVLVLGLGLGTAVASGLLAVVGLDGGLPTLLAGVAAGVVLGVAIVAVDAPSLLVAAITGYTGATWATLGVLLLVGRVQLVDLHGVGAAGALRGDVPALAAAFALGTLAFGFQALDLRAHRIDVLRREGYRF